MFVASVAVGKAFLTFEGKLPPELCPPDGYDSVVGQVGKVRRKHETKKTTCARWLTLGTR